MRASEGESERKKTDEKAEAEADPSLVVYCTSERGVGIVGTL